MHYQEYTPANSLQPYIDTYWVAKNRDQPIEFRILPDGYIDIVFDLHKEATRFPNSCIRIAGMMTKFRDIISKEHSETFGIRFKAGQFSQLSDFPFSQIKNSTINATEILPYFNGFLLEELINKGNQPSRIELIEKLLIKQLGSRNAAQSNLIGSVCASIEYHYDAINLVQIAQQHHISLRQLERRFKTTVGVTMKEYHSIVRFKKTVESIAKNPDKSLLLTAFDNGYFDHAHLTKDITKMAGMNPSQL